MSSISGTQNRREETERTRHWAYPFAYGLIAILLLVGLGGGAQMARAQGPGGSGGCQGQQGQDGNVTYACPGSDFTTSSWNSPWLVQNVNHTPCVAHTGTGVSYSGWPDQTTGNFIGAVSTNAEGTTSCSGTSAAHLSVDYGLHAASFTAWKPTGSRYTIEANFTMVAANGWHGGVFSPGDYVGNTCQDQFYQNGLMQLADAAYDQSTATGVGYSTGSNGNYSASWPWSTCTPSNTGQGTATYQITFTTPTTVTINQNDVIIPRAHILPTSIAMLDINNPPSTCSGNCLPSHDYLTNDFNNDGFGYIMLNSIWVS